MSEHTTDDALIAGIEKAVAAGTMSVYSPTVETATVNPTVRLIRVRFLEDEVYDGGIPMASYENARQEDHDWDPEDDADDAIDGAVRVLKSAGLSFAATGTDWAADPDGSQIIDYATAEREEVTGHLIGFSPDAVRLIIERVG